MPIDNQLEVSVGLTLAILDALRTLGVADPEVLLPVAGIDGRLLAKPENRIPLEQQQALWQLAEERSGSRLSACTLPAVFSLPASACWVIWR